MFRKYRLVLRIDEHFAGLSDESILNRNGIFQSR